MVAQFRFGEKSPIKKMGKPSLSHYMNWFIHTQQDILSLQSCVEKVCLKTLLYSPPVMKTPK
jgi:hypothetical protein